MVDGGRRETRCQERFGIYCTPAALLPHLPGCSRDGVGNLRTHLPDDLEASLLRRGVFRDDLRESDFRRSFRPLQALIGMILITQTTRPPSISPISTENFPICSFYRVTKQPEEYPQYHHDNYNLKEWMLLCIPTSKSFEESSY